MRRPVGGRHRHLRRQARGVLLVAAPLVVEQAADQQHQRYRDDQHQRVSSRATLRLRSLTTEGRTYALEGRVRGEDVTFKAGGKEYRGRMNGKTFQLL